MGQYINVIAHENQIDTINFLWEQEFSNDPNAPDFIVFSEQAIEDEITYIKKDPDNNVPSHLKEYINSVEDWEQHFPISSRGRGQIFWVNDDLEDVDTFNSLEKQIKFVLNSRFLFKEITGLNDAKDDFDIQIEGDILINGHPEYYNEPNFEDLPQNPKNKVFQLCLEFVRPDLWEAYLNYKDNPNNENWDSLRCKIIPTYDFANNVTVWQACEHNRLMRTDEDYGLEGFFRNGVIPSEFELYNAITNPPTQKEALQARSEMMKEAEEESRPGM